MNRLGPLISCASLSACSTMAPSIPPGYTGPVATLADTGISESTGKAAVFAVKEINGQRVLNSLIESQQASQGQGYVLTLRTTSRGVPTTPLNLKITGTHLTAAPIHEMAARVAGTFFSVEGTTQFTPLDGHSYIVTGELTKASSCVWIAERADNTPVTNKICS